MMTYKHQKTASGLRRLAGDHDAEAADRREADWRSFWDISSPFDAALVMLDLFGSNAVHAANRCIVSAAADNRQVDQYFWGCCRECIAGDPAAAMYS